MEEGSDCSDAFPRVCVIHFDGKEGQIKDLTQDTVEKIVERREQWLNLPSAYKNFTEVAKKSFEFIHGDFVENLNINEIAKNCCYHLACYRNFTDISKLERAKNTLTNAKRKCSTDNSCKKEDENNPTPEKIPRTPRQLFGRSCCKSTSGSPNVLPKFCLICKQHGPVYITDKVYVFFLIFKSV